MMWKWGNFPVPLQHLIGLLLGGILQALFPRHLFSNSLIGDVLGLALLVIGIGITAWSVVAAGEIDIEKPQQLVTKRPYAWSRNPMMVAWALAYLGAGFIVNSVWIVVLLLVVIPFTHFVDILREERFLTVKFGDEYRKYRRQVRRYL